MAFDESLYVTANFTTPKGKQLAKQSVPLIIRDTSTGALARYLEGTHSIPVYPGTRITVSLYASGGGGGASCYTPVYSSINGTDGSDSRMIYEGGMVVAGGGKGGTGGTWGNGSSFSNGKPGRGGWVDLDRNFSVFEIIAYANGADAWEGDRWSRQPLAVGFTNETGDRNDGGQGGWGIGDERWSYGGSGGAGSYIKVGVSNPTNVTKYLSIVVGATGRGHKDGNWGNDAGIGSAIVRR